MERMESMKKFIGCACILLILMGGIISSCSGKEAENKGGIEKLTDAVAEGAVEKMRAPVRQAEALAAAEEERIEDMARILDEQ